MRSSEESRSVAVIGAGMAGIASVKRFVQSGFTVTCLDRSDRAGGLWVDNYAEVGIQIPGDLYQFPEMPFPEEAGLLPKAQDICDYCDQFIQHYHLSECFSFNKEVTLIERIKEENKWRVHWSDLSSDTVDSTQKKSKHCSSKVFDFVVISHGLCSTKPNLPDPYIGQSDFQGRIIHSSEWRSEQEFDRHKVVVVGSGKSSLDCARIALRTADKVYQIYRSAHWYFPLFVLKGWTYKYAIHNRLAQSMLPPYSGLRSQSWLWLHQLTAPIKSFARKKAEHQIWTNVLRLPLRLKPEIPFDRDVLNAAGCVPEPEYCQQVRDGTLDCRIADIARFTKDGIILKDENETKIECDIVVFGTGWQNGFNFFSDEIMKLLDQQSDGLWLYRNVIHPDLEGLAFIGSNILTFTNPWSYSIQALWVSMLWQGQIPYPLPENQKKEIERVQTLKREVYPENPIRGAVINAHLQQYHDELLRDCNVNPHIWAGIAGFFKNWLWPVEPSQFAQYFEADDPRSISRKWVVPWPIEFSLVASLGYLVALKTGYNRPIDQAGKDIWTFLINSFSDLRSRL